MFTEYDVTPLGFVIIMVATPLFGIVLATAIHLMTKNVKPK